MSKIDELRDALRAAEEAEARAVKLAEEAGEAYSIAAEKAARTHDKAMQAQDETVAAEEALERADMKKLMEDSGFDEEEIEEAMREHDDKEVKLNL